MPGNEEEGLNDYIYKKSKLNTPEVRWTLHFGDVTLWGTTSTLMSD